MSKFSMRRGTMGVKIESTPYTAETLAATDFNIRVDGVTYSPTLEKYVRNYITGDFSAHAAVMGKRMCTISGYFDLSEGANVYTAPKEAAFFKMAGMKETTYTTTGIGWATHADYTNVPGTVEFVEKDEGTSPNQLVIKLAGAMCEINPTCEGIGQPVKVNVTITGRLESITDRAFGSILNPTGQDTSVPTAVLSSTITDNSEAQDFNTFSLALNNNIVMHEDPSTASGYEGAHLANRGDGPTITIDPFMQLLADRALYTRWTAGTEGAFSMAVGNYTISAPKIQVTEAYGRTDRNGFVSHNVVYQCNRSSGNDEVEILQGSKT